ncbi:hypothetical protein MMC18_006554 [Xylographa bjoerkii]|nr:hypothetical protein [Xylographa bjoerkii]
MFYSHESLRALCHLVLVIRVLTVSRIVLTSRKYGVATVWLVATLGSKSNLKKINRKAILDVDIPKACMTITQPEAPMALRLQSNLLYGVSRVYSQQCFYVLVDAQNTQNNMRTLLKVVRTSELDPEAGKARPDQLVLQDDPAFLPDIDLPSLDLDLSLFENSTQGSSQRTSVMSAGSNQSSRSSNKEGEASEFGLIIPTSDSGNPGDTGGFHLAKSGSSATKRDAGIADFFPEEQGFFPDVDFNFDAEGNMIELETPQAVQSNEPVPRGRSDSGVSTQIRQDQEEGVLAGHLEFARAMDLDLDIPMMEADHSVLPVAEPFPEMVSGPRESQSFLKSSSEVPDEEESESAEVAQVRERRGPRTIPVDEAPELRNSDLAQWTASYTANMAEVSHQKRQHRLPFEAKKNAVVWVFGVGIGGVGTRLTSLNVQSPLDMFAGDALMEALTGVKSRVTGRKRARSEENEGASESSGRRIRPRSEEEEVGRGESLVLDDEGMQPLFGDDSIEIGRDGPPLLEDFSSQMPWNITASAQGSRQSSMAHGRRFTSSVGGFPTSAGNSSSMPPPPFGTTDSFNRRASRLVSASPLLGRGPHRHSSIELPVHDNNEDLPGGRLLPDDQALEDFQLYGPAADVDTQTAAQSQWVRETLDRESTNFLEFVKAEMAATSAKVNEDEDELAGDFHIPKDFINFHELLPPAQHSKIVAAQAFHHMLALANKGLLNVDQTVGYGPIKVAVVDSV